MHGYSYMAFALNLGLAACCVSCDRAKTENNKNAALDLPSISTVEEITAQANVLVLNGESVCVRGWLDADAESKKYSIYHSSVDPFAPQSDQGVPRIFIEFETKPKNIESRLGQYINISGTLEVKTGASPDSKLLYLKSAKISTSDKRK